MADSAPSSSEHGGTAPPPARLVRHRAPPTVVVSMRRSEPTRRSYRLARNATARDTSVHRLNDDNRRSLHFDAGDDANGSGGGAAPAAADSMARSPSLPAMAPLDADARMDCYADDREFMMDFERYFNNAYLSDVTLIVGDEMFYAHRLLLVKSSDVFEKMLSEQWQGHTTKEIELVEESDCSRVFGAFLRFMYCNHVLLHPDNALPLLMLADKYNVNSLRKVCLNYAVNYILPQVTLKDLFHVWFQYGTKSYHQALVKHCIGVLAACFQDIINDKDWEKDWLALDRDQMAEFLRSNQLTVANEYSVWQAVVRWLGANGHPERRGSTAAPLLANLLPLVRFPFMTPDELSTLERSALAEAHPKLFQPHLMTAYKYQALPLHSRAGVKEFSGTQFLLRNYTELRWDKRLVIPEFHEVPPYTEVSLKFSTRASVVPDQSWEWDLKVHPKGFSSAHDDFRVLLSSNVLLDQTRSVEYLLLIVDNKRVLRSVCGRKTFTKTRYCADLEVEKKISIEELLADNSALLVNDNLNLQLTLKPID